VFGRPATRAGPPPEELARISTCQRSVSRNPDILKPVAVDHDGADNRRHVCYDPNRVEIDWRTYLRSGPRADVGASASWAFIYIDVRSGKMTKSRATTWITNVGVNNSKLASIPATGGTPLGSLNAPP
jgi:hypothetical protein